MTIADDYTIGRVSGEYVGYKRSAELVVSVEVTNYTWGTPRHTIAHGEVTQAQELTISAGVWNTPKTDFVTCGQITDALDHMVSYAPGWNAVKVKRLAEIWNHWHLNAMHAGCINQAGDNHEPCPETGYKWGSEWLVEPLPADIADELREMFQGR
jgi:hypothetical protein